MRKLFIISGLVCSLTDHFKCVGIKAHCVLWITNLQSGERKAGLNSI